MQKNEFKPVEKWHKTKTFTGPGDIQPLPVTVHIDEHGATLNSVWTLPIWQRVRFLFNGEITLRVSGTKMPPVALVNGDIFE